MEKLVLKSAEILRLLDEDKNVLLSGAPGTGKTTILNKVAEMFVGNVTTVMDPAGNAAFPTRAFGGTKLPGGNAENRKVFRTTFHQGTRYRDFVRGIIPTPSGDGVSFRVSRGVLFEASEYAKQDDHAALLIIDEINRGPAVAIFGDMISAFEADKRLSPEGKMISGRTVTVQIYDDDANLIDYQLPDRLFILAAMNQADSSVEPMDTAFLRRWRRVSIDPSPEALCDFFDIKDDDGAIPVEDFTVGDVYKAAYRAWRSVNEKIALGRGEAYQLGQGVFMKTSKNDLPNTVQGALDYVFSCWATIEAHIEEVFYGDKEAIAACLNAGSGSFFLLHNSTFAGRRVQSIKPSKAITPETIMYMYISIGE